MEFFRAGSLEWRAHCPMQGPHAFASTMPPIFSNMPRYPSLSTVYLTCSEPGVIVNSALAFKPWLVACSAMDAALVISSYDELVHEPINPTSNSSGQPFALTASANLDIGHAKSGVKGPLM